MDQISEQRLQQVYPALATSIRIMATSLAVQGIYIRVTQGLRTVAEQDALYAQGRTAPGKIVTNCQGGHSYHNFGMAVDCCPSKAGPNDPFDPQWDITDPKYARMVAAGRDSGLNCGADWEHFKDVPHFQLTGSWPVGAPPSEARELAASGLEHVWDVAFSSVPA